MADSRPCAMTTVEMNNVLKKLLEDNGWKFDPVYKDKAVQYSNLRNSISVALIHGNVDIYSKRGAAVPNLVRYFKTISLQSGDWWSDYEKRILSELEECLKAPQGWSLNGTLS